MSFRTSKVRLLLLLLKLLLMRLKLIAGTGVAYRGARATHFGARGALRGFVVASFRPLLLVRRRLRRYKASYAL
jgi:hypothetical protein